jgi:hypothetical protein
MKCNTQHHWKSYIFIDFIDCILLYNYNYINLRSRGYADIRFSKTYNLDNQEKHS